jgi:hypothetical protein
VNIGNTCPRPGVQSLDHGSTIWRERCDDRLTAELAWRMDGKRYEENDLEHLSVVY